MIKKQSKSSNLSTPKFIFPFTMYLLGFDGFGADQGKRYDHKKQ